MATYDNKLISGEQLENILEAYSADNQKMTLRDLESIHDIQEHEKHITVVLCGSFDDSAVDEYGTPYVVSHSSTNPYKTFTISIDDSITLPKDAVLFGNSLFGWNTRSNGRGHDFGKFGKVTAREIKKYATLTNGVYALYATRGQKRYIVHFDSQGGNYISPKTGIISSSTQVASTSPTRAGHTFEGWYTQPNGEGTKYVNTMKFKNLLGSNDAPRVIMLYANWTVNV